MTGYSTKTSVALLFLRIVVGAAFIIHGWPKMQAPFGWMGPDAPIPGFLLFLAALSEFGGGISLILGLLTPLFTLGMAFTMAVAVYFHASKGDPFVAHGGSSYELALVYLAVALLIHFAGPGDFAADRKIFGRK